MSTASIKCPSCGGERSTKAGRNQYVCQYCGTTFISESEITNHDAPPMTSLCQYCGGEIVYNAKKCRHCGEWLVAPGPVHIQQAPIYPQVRQQQYLHAASRKNKVTAALLAFFLGGFGIHEFYLGRAGAGLAFLFSFIVTCWFVFPMFIIGFICLVQAISYLCMSDQAFDAKYNCI